jgi:hypothetical protein
MFTIEEQSNPVKDKPLQFVRGFVDGLTNHPELVFWLTPAMLLGSETSLVRGVWIAHTVPITSLGAIVRMILMAVPYAMFLSFLGMLKLMCTGGQIGTEVRSKLRSSALSIIWSSYFCLLFVGP